MGRMGGIGGMRRIRVVDRKVTLVALRSFFICGLGMVGWVWVENFLIFLKIFFENFLFFFFFENFFEKIFTFLKIFIFLKN